MDDYFEANRLNWSDRAVIHTRPDMYALHRFIDDPEARDCDWVVSPGHPHTSAMNGEARFATREYPDSACLEGRQRR